MFFTREDILKIQNALLKLSIKDSELPNAEPVTYDDTLSIIQDGKNKQIKIEDFFNQISLWKREDFINITDKYDEHYISLIEAIKLVPVLQKKDGLVITFQDVEGNWEIYQFRGNITEFFNIEKWFNLYDYRNNIVKSIVPDEEDLTASIPDENGNSLVSLKDRVYNPTSFSGKGYKILRKNIVSGINTLTQTMINKSDTIYIIQYDFTLGEDITIPANCVLEFDGGSIIASGENTTIACNNTYFKMNNYSLNGVILSGTFGFSHFELPQKQNIGNLCQKILNTFGVLEFGIGEYWIDKPIIISKECIIKGQGSSTIIKVKDNINFAFTTDLNVNATNAQHSNVWHCNIKDLSINGDNKCKYGIFIKHDAHFYITNVNVNYCTTGIILGGWSHVLTNVTCTYNKYGIYVYNEANHLLFRHCCFGICEIGTILTRNGSDYELRNILFNNCDWEDCTKAAVIMSGVQGVKFVTCYFENNATAGLVNKNNDSSNYDFELGSGHSETFNIKSEIVLFSKEVLIPDTKVTFVLGNSYYKCTNVSFEECFFNSTIDSIVLAQNIHNLKVVNNQLSDTKHIGQVVLTYDYEGIRNVKDVVINLNTKQYTNEGIKSYNVIGSNTANFQGMIENIKVGITPAPNLGRTAFYIAPCDTTVKLYAPKVSEASVEHVIKGEVGVEKEVRFLPNNGEYGVSYLPSGKCYAIAFDIKVTGNPGDDNSQAIMICPPGGLSGNIVRFNTFAKDTFTHVNLIGGQLRIFVKEDIEVTFKNMVIYDVNEGTEALPCYSMEVPYTYYNTNQPTLVRSLPPGTIVKFPDNSYKKSDTYSDSNVAVTYSNYS